MRFGWVAAVFLLAGGAAANEQTAAPERAHDPDFQFRKVKIFSTTDRSQHRGSKTGLTTAEAQSNLNTNTRAQEAAVSFEKSYRLYGALSSYDQRQRRGQYFNFFWRAKRPADLTVRFEYKQEKLRSFVQAKELHYHDARGTSDSEFRIVGDEFFNDGRVLAWRCLLIEGGRVVAEKRSFLWN